MMCLYLGKVRQKVPILDIQSEFAKSKIKIQYLEVATKPKNPHHIHTYLEYF